VHPRPTPHELDQRVGHHFEVGLGQSGGGPPEAVAVATGVLGGDEALLAGDAHQRGAARLDQTLRGSLDAWRAADGQLHGAQVSQSAQEVGRLVERGRPPAFVERLQLRFQLG